MPRHHTLPFPRRPRRSPHPTASSRSLPTTPPPPPTTTTTPRPSRQSRPPTPFHTASTKCSTRRQATHLPPLSRISCNRPPAALGKLARPVTTPSWARHGLRASPSTMRPFTSTSAVASTRPLWPHSPSSASRASAKCSTGPFPLFSTPSSNITSLTATARCSDLSSTLCELVTCPCRRISMTMRCCWRRPSITSWMRCVDRSSKS